MILIVLYHFKIDLFQLGTDLNDGQFLGHRILDLKTLSAICFNTNIPKMYGCMDNSYQMSDLLQQKLDTNMGTRITSFYNTILTVRLCSYNLIWSSRFIGFPFVSRPAACTQWGLNHFRIAKEFHKTFTKYSCQMVRKQDRKVFQ